MGFPPGTTRASRADAPTSRCEHWSTLRTCLALVSPSYLCSLPRERPSEGDHRGTGSGVHGAQEGRLPSTTAPSISPRVFLFLSRTDSPERRTITWNNGVATDRKIGSAKCLEGIPTPGFADSVGAFWSSSAMGGSPGHVVDPRHATTCGSRCRSLILPEPHPPRAAPRGRPRRVVVDGSGSEPLLMPRRAARRRPRPPTATTPRRPLGPRSLTPSPCPRASSLGALVWPPSRCPESGPTA